ncbi:MAG: prolyl oligopeptidase family serine peptidase [Pseudomonadota bacterium]
MTCKRRGWALVGGPVASLVVGLQAFAAELPVAPVRPVVDTHFGVQTSDPYRYMEDTAAPEVQAWMKAHSDHAHRTLQALPERAAFLARLDALERAGSDNVNRVQLRNDGSLFFLRRGVADNQFKLMWRAPGSTQDRALFDPMTVSVPGAKPGQPQAINQFSASPQSTHVGVLVSAAGSEEHWLYVVEVASGRVVLGPLPRAGIPSWQSETQFAMHRLHAPGPGRTALDKYRDSELALITLPEGGQPAKDETLPGRAWPGLNPGRDGDVLVRRIPGTDQALVLVGNGVANELALYTGPWSELRNPTMRWTPVVRVEDGVVDYSVRGSTLYAVSHKGAPRQQVLAYDLAQPQQPPRLVLPASDRVVQRVVAARDALWVLAREGNVNVLLRQRYEAGAKFEQQPLPLAGQVYVDFGWGRDAATVGQDGLVIGLQGWTQGLRYLRVQAAEPEARDLGLPALAPIDAPTGLATTEVMVRSHDGAMVPMSIVHRSDVKRDGKNPVWLSAYASYGFTMEPNFRRERLAWLERGGVLAFANPRGSGVFGNDWYLAGKGIRKVNTWLDVIACAEHLIAEKWTNPRQLGFSGRSAGGLLAGRVLTARPDLFGAVVPAVGVHDGLRFEFEPNGPANIPEFGSVTTEEGFKGLLAMSPYAHVKDGTRYPPVLLPHGVNDPRVAVWESLKFAARLMAARQGDSPVLLRLDYDAGHGVGNTRAQQLEENADTYAFMWHHLTKR